MTVDVARIIFAQKEYRTTEVNDSSVLTRHPLSSQLDFNTLIKNEADAITFGNVVLGLRNVDRWTWACFLNKFNYPSLELGQTITLVYPRFGMSGGKNFIIKKIKVSAESMFYELNLFGPQT